MTDQNTNPQPEATPNTTPTPETSQGNTEGNTGAAFTQTDVDRISTQVRRETREVTQKKLLEELGLDDFDSLKSLLADAKQRKEAEMSEAEKLKTQLEAEQAKTKQATEALDALRLQRIADSRDAKVKELAQSAGAVDMESVLLNIQKDSALVAGLVNEDGTPNTTAIEKAIADIQAAKPHLFSAQVPNVPSNKGGKPLAPDKNALDAAKKAYMRRLRGN